MSAPAPVDAVIPATIKHPQYVATFDGSEDFQSWLKRLRRSYRQLNGNQDVGPSDLIQAMDSALSGEAAKFVGKNPLLKQIVNQADEFTATADDLVLFQNGLRDRFDDEPEVGIGQEGPFPTIEQGEGESLDTYHGRVLSIYRARGGRDKPVTPDQPRLTALEVSSINEWVHRFVLGLQDKALMSEAINDGALSSDSFRSALQRVKTSSGLLEVKARMARAVAERTRVNFMEGYIRQTSGQSANEELSRAYGLPKAMIDAWGGPRDQAMSVDTLMTQLQPSMAALGISGGWCPQHPQTYFAPRQGQFDSPHQANAFQFSTASHQSAYAPAVAPVPTTAPVPAPAVAPALTIAPVPAPVEHVGDWYPTVEVVEVSYAAMEPAPAPALVKAGCARVEASELCFADEHEEAQIAPVEHVEVSYAATEPAPAPALVKAGCARVEASELCFADEHEEAQIAPVEHVGDCYPTVEVVEVSHADIELSPTQHDFHEDADCAQGCATFVDVVEDVAAIGDVAAIEDFTAVEDFTAEYLPLRPIQGLKGVDEDASESVARDAQSRNPYINGSIPLPRGGACFRCGGAGHYVANCTATGDAVLTRWELAWLKSMVLPSRNDQNWTPDRADARSAQVYLDEDALVDDPAPATGTQYVGPPVGTRCIAVAAEPEPCSGAVESQCDSSQVFQFGESEVDGSQVFQFGETDAKMAGLCATVGEIVDEEVTLRPILKSLEKVDEDILEIPEAVPTSEKHQGISIAEVCGDDETPLPRAVPLVGEETVKRSIPALSEIWGRGGLGPIDWKALASRVCVPLMESCQIRSELLRESRELSSSVIVRRKRKKKKKEVGVVVAPRQSHSNVGLAEVANRILKNVLNKVTENLTDWDLHLPSVTKILTSCYIESVGFSPVEVLYGLSRASDVGLEVFLTQASHGWDDHFCRSLAWPLEMSLEGDSRVHWMGRVEERRSEVQCRGQLEAVGRRDLHEQRIVKPFDPGGYCDGSGRGKATKAAAALVWSFSHQNPGWSCIVSTYQS
ncbi:hypothetical protein E4U51_000080 [Claviceps purpurea]|nr:hypothetical protein E4U51_000080 [Claviceps purpurea]